jgi:hypothetical protein
VKPADGLYAPLPVTVAVPTVAPPDEQSVGALDCGPNTVHVTVPDGDEPPYRPAVIAEGSISVPAVPVGCAPTDIFGLAAPTMVSVIAEPQPESAALL